MMTLKPNIVHSLKTSRRMLENLIDSLSTPEQWMAQPCPKANHALWVVGHLALADNMFASRVVGEEPITPEGWEQLFWFGSEVHSDASKYPPVDEVVKYFRERRENLMNVIDEIDDAVLLGPAPSEGMFAEAPNLGQMLFFISYHEGIHTGQVTVAHRSLGHEPMMKPKPAAT